MSENELHSFEDRNIIPTEELIFSIIGENRVFWQRIMKYASENYGEISGSWNYYNDGKQWLFKLVHRKKTLLWAAILKDTFRVTFWFSDKAAQYIEAAVLPPAVKDDFTKARKYGSIRAVSIVVREQSDADIAITLLSLKYKIK
jgi:hypothetical protein